MHIEAHTILKIPVPSAQAPCPSSERSKRTPSALAGIPPTNTASCGTTSQARGKKLRVLTTDPCFSSQTSLCLESWFIFKHSCLLAHTAAHPVYT